MPVISYFMILFHYVHGFFLYKITTFYDQIIATMCPCYFIRGMFILKMLLFSVGYKQELANSVCFPVNF